MFIFQEIPSVQVGFGFAVELFIIVFSFLCWLFFPAKSNPLVTAEKETVERDLLVLKKEPTIENPKRRISYVHSCGQKIAYGLYSGLTVFYLEDPYQPIDNCPGCGQILPDFLPSSLQYGEGK